MPSETPAPVEPNPGSPSTPLLARVVPSSGIHTTEFYLTIGLIVMQLLLALGGLIPPEHAAVFATITGALYKILRTALKISQGGVDLTALANEVLPPPPSPAAASAIGKLPLLLILALGSCFFGACASTEVRENGQRVFRTHADAQSIELTTKNTHLLMLGVNHSQPTLAGGQSFKLGADSLGTTVVSGVLAGGLPWAKATAAGTQIIPQIIAPVAPAVLQSKH